jgi:hypothetical protein
VATDDFDDMLAEFAASDLESGAKSTSAATASTAPSGSSPTEHEIVNACAKGDVDRLCRWGRRGIRVASTRPLLFAALKNNVDMIMCLVDELGANANEMMADGSTPLIVAVQKESLGAMRCLVMEVGADINLAGHDGFTPLLMAASLEHLECVRCLVKDLGATVNQLGRGGRTALHYAASGGNLDLVRLLVKELGADVDLVGHENGSTPLMAAAFFKYEKITNLLLKAGADAQALICVAGKSYTAASSAAALGASAKMTEYLEAKTHCSNSGCDGAGIRKCTGCKQARYCGQAYQLAYWPAHEARCKAHQTKVGADT